jgi:microsomal dipeptidase-like Zn-dependent dipeptidase
MDKYIDIHCHPALKPYSKSYANKKVNSKKLNDKSSIWHYNPPTISDKLINYAGTLTRFSQSNFSALSYGNVGIVCASLYPMEKGFLVADFGTGPVADIMANLVTGIGKPRINRAQQAKEYFSDLVGEYDFYRQLNGVKIFLDKSEWFQYRLVKSFADIQENEMSKENIISVILSIEGGHALDTGLGEFNAGEAKVLENAHKIKDWEFKPFFITFTHHFYNNLAGHSSSLAPILTKMLNQSEGLDSGFTDLGLKVLDVLLDNKDGKRILIDIKHLSPLARKQYFEMLDTKYAGEQIPIIMSHGAVNGYHSPDNKVVMIPDSLGLLNDAEINFYDVEILELAKRGGVIGIQMDERRLVSLALLKQVDGKLTRKKILYYRSKLFWNQVRHIAEVLDNAGYFGWGVQSVGTDFDGIVDPLNGFWTSEELTFLDDYLLKHAYNYMQTEGRNLKLAGNRNIDHEEIVSRVMTDNAYDFFRKYFK